MNLKLNDIEILIIKLTMNGEVAKTHDPTTHLSREFATIYRQGVHLESLLSEEFTALAPNVWSQGIDTLLSIFRLLSRLSGSNLNEPEFYQ